MQSTNAKDVNAVEKTAVQPTAVVDDEAGGAELALTPEVIAAARKLVADRKKREELESRMTAGLGNPDAVIADPFMQKVEPRYKVVQNQSPYYLIIPDLKTGPEDMGLALQPGEAVKLTDFYSPTEINRSKGLRFASTKLNGFTEGSFALVPIASEEAAADFKLPKKTAHAKGDVFDDLIYNDFDKRFEELEQKDAKAEERLRKKTLAGRVTKQHGAAPSSV